VRDSAEGRAAADSAVLEGIAHGPRSGAAPIGASPKRTVPVNGLARWTRGYFEPETLVEVTRDRVVFVDAQADHVDRQARFDVLDDSLHQGPTEPLSAATGIDQHPPDACAAVIGPEDRSGCDRVARVQQDATGASRRSSDLRGLPSDHDPHERGARQLCAPLR
jgi:hypothetical protein